MCAVPMHQYIIVWNLFYSLKGNECWMLTEISLSHLFLSQKHTKEVGRPQTPLKETTLEPWTQPQVGWNFSVHFFPAVVVSVSIHGNNLQRNIATSCSGVLLSHCRMICFGFWLPRLLAVSFELVWDFFWARNASIVLPSACASYVLKNFCRTRQNRTTLVVLLVCL